MNKNYWGEPDDIEPFPDWMLAETHRNPFAKKVSKQSVEEAAAKCLKKAPIDVSNYTPEIK